MDGDGFRELVIGASCFDQRVDNGGRIYFVPGREKGWSLHESLRGYASVDGLEERQELHEAVPIGDVNGDGLADVALNSGASNGNPPAVQYIFLGRRKGWQTGLPADQVDVVLQNQNNMGKETGSPLSSKGPLGDMDGDGLDDWMMFGQVIKNGEVHVVSGASLSPEMLVPRDSAFWVYSGEEDITFAVLGDVNGDGLQDVKGRQNDWEHFYVFLGSSGTMPVDQLAADAADITFYSPADNPTGDLVSMGDLNGDGLPDLLLYIYNTASDTNWGGYLFFGRSEWQASYQYHEADVVVFPGAKAYVESPVGDINGDGLDDLLLRSEGDGPELSGSSVPDSYVVFGRSGVWPAEIPLSDADVHFAPSEDVPEIFPPRHSEAAGDLNGDGIQDMVFTSPYLESGGNQSAGLAAVFLGRSDWPTELTMQDAEVRFVGTQRGQRMGSALRLGDLNADGYDEFIVPSGMHPVRSEEGETFIFFGQPSP